MEHTELYREFERVIVDPEHSLREIEEAREEELRTSSGSRENPTAGSVQKPQRSYARRVLELIRKPHEQWNPEDRALAARIVEEAHFTANPAAQERHHEARHEAREEQASRKLKFNRDEFDRRLWGLPPRPNLSH